MGEGSAPSSARSSRAPDGLQPAPWSRSWPLSASRVTVGDRGRPALRAGESTRRVGRRACPGVRAGCACSTGCARSGAKPLLAWTMLRDVLAGRDARAAQRADRRRGDPAARDGPGRHRPAERGARAGRACRGVVAMTSRRSERLIRTMVISLFFWGAAAGGPRHRPDGRSSRCSRWSSSASRTRPTTSRCSRPFQRASANEDRAPVLSVLEVVIALGAIAGSLLAPVFVGLFGRARRAVRLGPDPAARRGPHLLADAPGR